MIKFKTKEEIIAQYGKRFETHKAELIQNTDRFCIIDWQREDKSIDYYINPLYAMEEEEFPKT